MQKRNKDKIIQNKEAKRLRKKLPEVSNTTVGVSEEENETTEYSI